MIDAEPHRSMSRGDVSLLPQGINCRIIIRLFFGPAAEMLPSGLGRGDALGLSLTDELALRLGHIAQKLQHDIRDQRSRKIPALASVQQRHIQYNNGCLLLFRDDPPLLQNFIIVSSQPVNALDDESIARLDSFQQAEICRPVKIYAALLLLVDPFYVYPKLPHCQQLPI